MSEMLELAERCERLEGPNYAIEVEIFKAIHPEYADYVQGRGGLVHRFDGSDQRVLSDIRPGNYTASLDSAMTLVPAGSDIMVDNFDGPHNKRCSASVYSPRPMLETAAPPEGRPAGRPPGRAARFFQNGRLNV